MRLIDADELMKEFEANGTWWEQARLEEAPTVDAVPVVRCKDCKYAGGTTIDGDIEIFCKYSRAYFLKDSFCSYGERKDDKNG